MKPLFSHRFFSAIVLASLAGLAIAMPLQPPTTVLIFPQGAISDIRLEGSYLTAFAGWTRGYGVMLFDIATVDAPVFKGGAPLPGYVKTPLRHATWWYVPTTFGLSMVYSEQGTIATQRDLLLNFSARDAPARQLALTGKNLLMAGNTSARLFDISDPAAPLLREFNFDLSAKNVLGLGNDFYVWNKATLSRLDLTSGPRAIYTNSLPLRGVWPLDNTVNPKVALLDQKQNLRICSFDNAAFTTITNIPQVLNLCHTAAGSFAVQREALLLLDIQQGQPVGVQRRFLRPDGFPNNFAFNGTHFATVAGDYNRTIELREAASPDLQVRSTIPLCRSDGDVAVTPAAIYLGSGNQLLIYRRDTTGLIAQPAGRIDVALPVAPDPQQCKTFGAYNLLTAWEVAPFDNYLLFSGALLNIAAPLHPVFIGNVTAQHSGLARDGNRIALAQGDRITLADIAALPDFKTLATYECASGQGPMLAVALRGKRLCAIDTKGYYIFDIAADNAITLRENHPLDSPCALALVNEHLYIPTGSAATQHKLVIHNLRQSTSTTVTSLIDHGITRMAATTTSLFMADGFVVKRFALHNPDNPRLMARYTAHAPDENANPRTDFTALKIVGNHLFARQYGRLVSWPIQEDTNE